MLNHLFLKQTLFY